MTIMRPLAAFCTAITAGILENIFFWEEEKVDKKEEKNSAQPLAVPIFQADAATAPDGNMPQNKPQDAVKNQAEPAKESFVEKLYSGINFAVNKVWGDIALWFFIGTTIAALITVLVPDALMSRFLGGGLGSMLIMLAAGIPLYICATASTPIAAALILKGVSPGAALVFLLVGPATNVASISVLFKVLGKKSTALYLVVVAASAVLFGLVVDGLYASLSLTPRAALGSAEKMLPFWLQFISLVVLLTLSLRLLIGKKRGQKAAASSAESGD